MDEQTLALGPDADVSTPGPTAGASFRERLKERRKSRQSSSDTEDVVQKRDEQATVRRQLIRRGSANDSISGDVTPQAQDATPRQDSTPRQDATPRQDSTLVMQSQIKEQPPSNEQEAAPRRRFVRRASATSMDGNLAEPKQPETAQKQPETAQKQQETAQKQPETAQKQQETPRSDAPSDTPVPAPARRRIPRRNSAVSEQDSAIQPKEFDK